MFDLRGKTAFVTGGAGGIGLGITKVLLRNGMNVVAADLLPERLVIAASAVAEFGERVHFLQLDVSDRKAMLHAADEAERRYGNIHVLCNNAGVRGSAPIDVALYEDWDWVMGVNFNGVVNGIVSFLPRIKAHGEGGHIVNTSSVAGLIPMPGDGGVYSASKFAVRGLSDSLRLALAKFDIGVSVLCPGITRSYMLQSEKCRPAHLATPASRLAPALDDPSLADAGMDPVEVGECVLRAIQRNEPYILTHGEFKDELKGLFDEILAAFPGDQLIDPLRLAFEAGRRAEIAEAKAAMRKA